MSEIRDPSAGTSGARKLGLGLLSVQRLSVPVECLGQALLIDVVRPVGALKEVCRHSSSLLLRHPKVALRAVVAITVWTNGLLALGKGVPKRARHGEERTCFPLPFLRVHFVECSQARQPGLCITRKTQPSAVWPQAALPSSKSPELVMASRGLKPETRDMGSGGPGREPRDGSPPEGHADCVEGTVLADSKGASAQLRLADGSELELPVPEDLSKLFREGQRVLLYHDAGGELLGWYLPDEQMGLDLRG
jgi:hypothetical protein